MVTIRRFPMTRLLLTSASGLGVLLATLLLGMPSVGAQTVATNVPPTGIALTANAPTGTPAPGAMTGSVLPSGALVLLQRNQPVALLPNGQPVSLRVEQYGVQASGNSQYGVRFDVVGTGITLILVDNRSGQAKAIPQGSGLIAPAVTWKRDGSGVAFTDFGVPGKLPVTKGAILYYTVASGATSVLIAPPAGQTATALGWSADGRYLIYESSPLSSSDSGALTVTPQLWDSSSGKSSPLPAAAASFAFWDRASVGFFVQQSDISKGTSVLLYFPLNALDKPVTLTPASTLDFLADVSPDGKSVVVSSQSAAKGAAPVANLYVMSLSGANRKAITTFKTPDQAITALIWGADGIYYSLSGSSTASSVNAVTSDTTWRVDLDGQNARQVALGTLIGIVGIR